MNLDVVDSTALAIVSAVIAAAAAGIAVWRSLLAGRRELQDWIGAPDP